MENISPTIISSKPAERHLETVKMIHNDAVEGMKNQAIKVNAFNREQDAIKVQQDAVKAEQDKQIRAEQAASQKEQMAYALKTKELEVKKMALSQTD